MSKSNSGRRRAWTVLLVSPNPSAATRQLRVSVRAVVGAGTFALTLIAAAATWTGETSSIAMSAADGLAASQRTVLTLLDSVHVLNVVAADARAARLPPRDMILPVAGVISSGFSTSRFHPILQLFRAHEGVDLSAPAGTRIVAPASGRVTYVGWRFGYGLTIELQHSGGIVTRFAHCRSALVWAGAQVTAGQAIATVGSTGLSTGPHVHFEVVANGTAVDPIKFLARTRQPAGSGTLATQFR